MSGKFLAEIMKLGTEMSKTIVVDLDGVIVDFENCPNRGICDYSGYPTSSKLKRTECKVNPSASTFLNRIRDELGLKIVIVTSRVQSESYHTKIWLKTNNIPYDEIHFNKPRGLIYIDDLGHEFKSWSNVFKEIKKRIGDKT
jgi:hypothetical protein